MKREIKFRAFIDGEMKQVTPLSDGHVILGFAPTFMNVVIPIGHQVQCIISHEPIEVMQLQYTSPKGVEYYDGDIYYHAGYGKETVSPLCELQMALISGNADDIGEVIGNIYSNPINSI